MGVSLIVPTTQNIAQRSSDFRTETLALGRARENVEVIRFLRDQNIAKGRRAFSTLTAPQGRVALFLRNRANEARTTLLDPNAGSLTPLVAYGVNEPEHKRLDATLSWGTGGSNERVTISLYLFDSVIGAPSASLDAHPLSLRVGQSAIFSWNTKNVDTVTVASLSGGPSVRPPRPLICDRCRTVTFPREGTFTYELTATGPRGSASDQVTVTVTRGGAALCSNNVIEPPEQCDDGNKKANDQCSYTNTTPACQLTFCGDGIVQNPNGVETGGKTGIGDEQCDLGSHNGVAGSTCDAVCRFTAPPPTFCGDEITQTPNSLGEFEQCDDGARNGRAGSNCSATCQITGGGQQCSAKWVVIDSEVTGSCLSLSPTEWGTARCERPRSEGVSCGGINLNRQQTESEICRYIQDGTGSPRSCSSIRYRLECTESQCTGDYRWTLVNQISNTCTTFITACTPQSQVGQSCTPQGRSRIEGLTCTQTDGTTCTIHNELACN